jgi:uncharacterized protein YjdB
MRPFATFRRPHSTHAQVRAVFHSGFIALLMLGAGCSNSSLPLAPQIPNTNTSGSTLYYVQVSATAHSVRVGSTLQLQAQGLTVDDSPVAVNSTWTSQDAKIATVSAKGILLALKPGTVMLTAKTVSTPQRVGTITVRVLASGETPPPEPVNTDTSGTLADGTSAFPFATDGASPSVTNTSGGFTPPDGSGTLPSADVGQAPVGSALSIYPQSPRVAVGDRLRLVALQGADGKGAPTAVAWHTSNAKTASIDEAGNISGQAAGIVTITASSLAFPALQKTTILTVTAAGPAAGIQGIRITPSRVLMNVSETFWLLAEVPTLDGGFDPHVRWESGDQRVVTVSDTGQITAMGPGKTVVTAIASGYSRGNLSATVPVEVRNTTTVN